MFAKPQASTMEPKRLQVIFGAVLAVGLLSILADGCNEAIARRKLKFILERFTNLVDEVCNGTIAGPVNATKILSTMTARQIMSSLGEKRAELTTLLIKAMQPADIYSNITSLPEDTQFKLLELNFEIDRMKDSFKRLAKRLNEEQRESMASL